LGTGTTLYASIASCRNSIGIEIDNNFNNLINSELPFIKTTLNKHINDRLNRHIVFVENYQKLKKDLKHRNNNYNFPVMTQPEIQLIFNYIKNIEFINNTIVVNYVENATIENIDNFTNQLTLAL
jgi:hypothetical protein